MQPQHRQGHPAAIRVLGLYAVLLPLAAAALGAKRFPVIYCADLLHPHDDAVDHLDLAMV